MLSGVNDSLSGTIDKKDKSVILVLLYKTYTDTATTMAIVS